MLDELHLVREADRQPLPHMQLQSNRAYFLEEEEYFYELSICLLMKLNYHLLNVQFKNRIQISFTNDSVDV